jgi:hypothetical protein
VFGPSYCTAYSSRSGASNEAAARFVASGGSPGWFEDRGIAKIRRCHMAVHARDYDIFQLSIQMKMSFVGTCT